MTTSIIPLSDSAPAGNAPIAIVGIGCRYPGARNPKELWANILGRRRQFRRIPDVRLPLAEYQDDDRRVADRTYGTRAAVIDGYQFDWAAHRIPRSAYESTDIAHWLALDVALQMLDDAGYEPADLPHETTQVVVGNTLTGEFTRSNTLRLRWPFVNKVLRATALRLGMRPEAIGLLSESMEHTFKSVFTPVTEDTLAGGLANTIAGRICNYLNLNGGGYTVDGACSSSLLAVHAAAASLASGSADFAIAGGVDVSLDPFELVGFAKTGALTPTEMSVYDKRGNGFIPGEGCGFVGLKRLADARRDGDKVYAVLDGWGMSSDGKGGLTAPSVNGQSIALCRAYEQAGIDPGSIHFIEGHGTGTAVGDRTELLGIARALSRNGDPGRRRCGVTSFKSIAGHTKAAAGVGALIKAAIAANQRVVPPTAGCALPHDVFSGESTCLYPVLRGAVHPPHEELRAGVSAMGFGGINVHVTLRSGEQPVQDLRPEIGERAAMASTQDSELFCLSAATVPELAARAEGLRSDAIGASLAELADLAAWLNPGNDARLPVKAAVVARSPEELSRRLDALVEHLRTAPPQGKALLDRDNGLIAGHGLDACSFGFVFPGQGSQRTNMARTLVERFDWARALLDDADRWARELGTDGLSSRMYPDADRQVGKDEQERASAQLSETQWAQPAIVLASLLWRMYLERLGLSAGSAMGHSLGELTAFHAAGAFEAKTLIQLATLRGQLMARIDEAPSGGMLSLACGRHRAQALVDEVVASSPLVVVANINAPSQTVVSGVLAAIRSLQQLARDHGIAAHRLAVSNAFHSPLVAKAAARLRELTLIPRSPSRIDGVLISSCDGRRVTAGVDMREHFAAQIVKPVDFIGAVESLSAHCDVAVEVGPGGTLSHLMGQIGGGEGLRAWPVERTAESFDDLNWLVGLAHVHGKPVAWDELYARRIIKPFVSAKDLSFIVNPCERPLDGAGAPGARLAGEILAEREGERAIPEVAHTIAAASAKDGGALPAAPQVAATAGASASAERVLLDLAAQLTGFDRATLVPTASLTDDLNLDSIKIADLISRAEAALGIDPAVDPATAASATICEVAGRMEARRSSDPRAAGGAPPVQPTRPAGWVRAFEVRLIPCALDADRGPAPEYGNRLVAIQCDQDDRELAAALGLRLTARGARVLTLDDVQMLRETRTDIDRIVVVLPRSAPRGALASELLARSVARMRAAAVTSARQASCAGLSCVQFGGVGDGLTQLPGSFVGSCASSFAASLHLERPALGVRVLDFHPSAGVEFAADRIMDEQSGPEAYVFCHYGEGGRRHLLVPRPIEPQIQPARALTWSERDVVIVTGGAKGITAECALAFAKATRARMMLLGSSPGGEQGGGEIGETLSRYAQAGLFARYYQCNIVDAGALQRTLAEIARQFGPVTAVIHGAGLNRPRRAEQVEETDALSEVSPKLQGLFNILESDSLQDTPPKLVAGMSSIIGITGMAGNAWYAFSNEALNVCLQRYRATHPGTETVALAYSLWADVGMGARMGSAKHLEKLGVSPIAKDAGVAHFLHCVSRETAAQVVIASRLGGLDTWRGPGSVSPAANRFLQDIQELEPGVELVARARLTLEDDLYLGDHYYRGVHLFPTVFGLEAMAQSVAKVLGLQALGSLKVVDIKLTRPIVVSGDKGTEIQIKADVAERKTASEPVAVRVGIGTEQTAFQRDHFSATFVLEDQGLEVESAEGVSLPASPVDIDPRTELYGGLLFQGPLFQRLERVWSMTSAGSVVTIRRSRGARYFSPRFSQETILGDPCCRDVLLQSAQLSVKGILLPIGIDALHLSSLDRPGPEAVIARNVMTARDADGPICDVTAVSEQGHRAVERLVGYRLKQMEHDDAAPEPEDWADPSRRDARTFAAAVAAGHAGLHESAPECSLTFLPELSRFDRSKRRVRERSLLLDVASRALGANGEPLADELEILWRDDGKPMVRGRVGIPPDGTRHGDALEVSLSHDRSHCLCVAGRGPQGCDLEPIERRSRPEWLRLLGAEREELFERLIDAGDSLDEAGTRIWCALETVTKALGPGETDLTLLRWHDRSALLTSHAQRGTIRIVTLPLSLTRPPQKMLAMTAVSTAGQATRPHALAEPTPSKESLDARISSRAPEASQRASPGPRVTLEAGVPLVPPTVEPELRSRFRVTFKDVTTSLHGLQFDTIADWMGRIREVATVAIAKELVADFASGKWGMVTNHSNIRIAGRVGCLDLVEGRMCVSRAHGKFGSSVDLSFEWIRIGEDGMEEAFAFSDMTTTWVEILDHGVVEVRPFPEYMQQLIDSYLAAEQGKAGSADAEGARRMVGRVPELDAQLGEALYRAPGAPRVEPELLRIAFDTASAESNLVGNIYYASYYHWQARLIDRLFHGIPSRLSSGARSGELTCVRSSVVHLREAMPFDRIEVAMGLQGLHRRGVKLHFEFYRVAEDGQRVKLAVGEYAAVWTDAATGAPGDLPSTYLSLLTGRLPVAA